MSAFDVIVRGATVAVAGGPERLDAGVLDGRIDRTRIAGRRIVVPPAGRLVTPDPQEDGRR